MRVGILALQGAVEPHREKFKALGVDAIDVRTPQELAQVAGLVLPGGESTTMLKLLDFNRLWEPLVQFSRTKPCWGVCAGAILLAKDVASPSQASLEAIDIGVERNAFGRQVDSFVDKLVPAPEWTNGAVEGIFIRAPRIRRLGPGVRTLFRWQNEAVMVEEKQNLASTFHPELGHNLSIHQYFLKKVRDSLG